MKKTKIGVVGCGKISTAYFEAPSKCSEFEIVACCDIIPEAARAMAKEHGIPQVLSLEEMLSSPGIDIILNLTLPETHASIAMAALNAGKSVYNEKPLAISLDEAREMLELAGQKGLRVGCAPDTFMGAGLQTCRKLLDSGEIGEPVAATAFMMCHGHENWHPNPAFYYQVGAGPMFDMGPYYLTALVHLIGPIKRVCSSARVTFPQRTITSELRRGEIINVNTPTHVTGIFDFSNGAIGTIITSFDVWSHNLPCIEIYGTEGSMVVPDPNCFDGTVRLLRAGESEWRDIDLIYPHPLNSRGLGLADMAAAIQEGRPHRASGEIAYHVLETMHAMLNSSKESRHITIGSTCDRPAPMPAP